MPVRTEVHTGSHSATLYSAARWGERSSTSLSWDWSLSPTAGYWLAVASDGGVSDFSRHALPRHRTPPAGQPGRGRSAHEWMKRVPRMRRRGFPAAVRSGRSILGWRKPGLHLVTPEAGCRRPFQKRRARFPFSEGSLVNALQSSHPAVAPRPALATNGSAPGSDGHRRRDEPRAHRSVGWSRVRSPRGKRPSWCRSLRLASSPTG